MSGVRKVKQNETKGKQEITNAELKQSASKKGFGEKKSK